MTAFTDSTVPKGFPVSIFAPGFGSVDEHDIAQFMLRVVSDANRARGPFHFDPFIVLCIAVLPRDTPISDSPRTFNVPAEATRSNKAVPPVLNLGRADASVQSAFFQIGMFVSSTSIMASRPSVSPTFIDSVCISTRVAENRTIAFLAQRVGKSRQKAPRFLLC